MALLPRWAIAASSPSTERGMALADLCDAKLSEAEATLEQLVATAGGELVAETIAWDDENDDEDDDAA